MFLYCKKVFCPDEKINVYYTQEKYVTKALINGIQTNVHAVQNLVMINKWRIYFCHCVKANLIFFKFWYDKKAFTFKQ